MLTEQNKYTWCVDAEHSIRFDNDGTSTMCCMQRPGIVDNFRSPDIKAHLDKETFIEVRRALNAGEKHPWCQQCWTEEASGRASKRVRDIEKYINDTSRGVKVEGLTSMELNLGNICNIKCRTCHPAVSSTWIPEYFEIHKEHQRQMGRGNTLKEYSKNLEFKHTAYLDDSPFWDSLEEHLGNLRELVFYGGEPFLSKRMWKVLKVAVDKGYAKNIALHYNTNGTTWNRDEIEVWEHFRRVHLSFSVDGVNDKFEYMRFPANWGVLTQNMKQAVEYNNRHKNLYASCCVTLSMLNIFYVEETVRVLSELVPWPNFAPPFLNLVHFPEYFNIGTLPPHIKSIISDKLLAIPNDYRVGYAIPGIVDFMNNGTFNQARWNEFIINTRKSDVYRNQDYAETFPEFAELIGYQKYV